MPHRTLVLVAYDVAALRRGARVLDLVKAYATGGQKSVHECWITEAERRELVQALERRINPREDTAVLLRLDPRARPRCLGVAVPPRDPAFFYFG